MTAAAIIVSTAAPITASIAEKDKYKKSAG
jgi:hypothetical protein